MKKLFLLILLVAFAQLSFSQGAGGDEDTVKYASLQQEQTKLKKAFDDLSLNIKRQGEELRRLSDENNRLRSTVDSLGKKCSDLAGVQDKDRKDVSGKIEKTNSSVSSNTMKLKERTYWGIGIIVFIILFIVGVYLFISRRIKRGDISITEMHKAQNTLQEAQSKLQEESIKLQEAQSKLQEESIKLDNTFIEIIEKQLKAVPVAPTGTTSNAPDHSLALKVADEIVRIEMNLSRMNPAVKGHKPLSKAVQRLRDNFKANGYDIVEMLGKPYDEGMKADVNFVSDDTLPEGQQIITGITKPQINYNGKMIQKAQITVSQNI